MKQPARTSTRQPLISRAMKVGLMAEQRRLATMNRGSAAVTITCVIAEVQSRKRKKMIDFSLDCPIFRQFQAPARSPMGTCRGRPCRGRRARYRRGQGQAREPMTAPGTCLRHQGRQLQPTNSVPFGVDGRAFRRPAAARFRLVSAAAAPSRSGSRSAPRGPPAAAGLSAIRGPADGAGSSPATAAAAPGRQAGRVQRRSRTKAGPPDDLTGRLDRAC